MNRQGRRWGERIPRALTGICIGAALAFAPMAFGAAEPWAFVTLAALAYAALAAAAVRAVLARDFRPFAAPMLVPLALGLCLVLLQRAAWPAKLMSLAAPRTLAAYADTSATLAAGWPASIPGSVYPHGTSLALVRFSSYVALFAATLSYVRGLREIIILGIVVFSVGFAAALVGILQSVSGADRIYWLRKAPHAAFFGPFAGRNQYAAYAALCTFVGVGLLLARGSRWIVAQQTWAEWLVANGPQVVLLVFGIGVVGASVAWSLSRAGTLSMLLGFSAVFGAVALIRRRARHWALVAASFCAVLAVLTSLGWGRVIARLSTLEDIVRDPTATWRWRMFGDALRMGRDFPAMGVGAGAFASAYPVYRTIPSSSLVESPHNEYLHVFAETGAPGALLMILGLLIAFGAVLRGLCAHERLGLAGFMAGGLGAVVSVSAHSLFDYPMRSPAIAATAAVLVAMLCRAAALERRKDGLPAGWQGRPAVGAASAAGAFTRRLPFAHGGALLGLGLVAVLWGSGTWWALGPLRADLQRARLDAASQVPPQRAVGRLLAGAERVRRDCPDDAALAAHLGDLAVAVAAEAGDPLTALRLRDLALAQHRAAALAEPLNAAHLVALAEDSFRSGRPDLAWSCAERARELVPGNVSLLAHLAQMFGSFGYASTAEGYLSEAERVAKLWLTPEAAALTRAARARLGSRPDGKGGAVTHTALSGASQRP